MNILLKNDVVLIHDTESHVVPTHMSILIENGKIAKIGSDIETSDGVEQTQLKGRHANEQVLEYMVTGNLQSCQFSLEDVFYGQLAAMLEGIAAGTTTVVKHVHVTCSPDHAKLGVVATASSGIRSVFCYTPIMGVKKFNPLRIQPNPFKDWVMQTFHQLADKGPFGEGRVTLGFAFDLLLLPPEMIRGLFTQVKEKGVKTITTHGSVSLGKVVQSLKSLDLPDESTVISHGGEISIGLQNARNTFGEYHMKQGKLPRTIPENLSVEAAFNLAIIKGVEAVNTSRNIGRLAEGFEANIVVFDALSPSMVAAAQHDPVAAINLHSTSADIDTVIVDGIIRKEGGKVLPVAVDDAAQEATDEAIID
ncbi:hypothetical protein BU25DRAFT_468706 [Macroventuria anomochaeta]|uniref:Uncharacterized protein n=1 Tax=Macroventuria anomochaeta TaxID=301207 RepID=A0ACB6S145_9PLEO|nr:uncharacterized protein BU25DRAFT_468706 [Macroventuria anomochaeta]KAF2627673.1 hypothetical protein BU25DRAFT_468706 [Macroventuria anomochaeta]